jgi:ATP-binding cassette subfamily F protein uup
VLDEPTNDLDMDTMDLLAERLETYDGTLILVSHDRAFIDRLATSTLALDGVGNYVESPGGWLDFTDQNPNFFKNDEPLKIPVKSAKIEPAKATPAKKMSYKDQKRLSDLELFMPKWQGDIAAMEQKLADPLLFSNNPKEFEKTLKNLEATRELLENGELEWLLLEEKKNAL